jgi:hypothetical protein
MKSVTQLVGQKFGKLTVLAEDGSLGKDLAVICECECGNTYRGRAYALKSGNTKSCGCAHYEKATKHGYSGHKLYKVWAGAVQRCTNPNSQRYGRYGGRGITMYEPWLHSPEEFVAYCLGLGWTPELTIDRIDNDGNYEPGNLRAVTAHENLLNRKASLARVMAAKENVVNAWRASCKPVRCLETGIEFPTVKEAAEYVGRRQTNITKAILRNGTCGGFHFEFITKRETP